MSEPPGPGSLSATLTSDWRAQGVLEQNMDVINVFVMIGAGIPRRFGKKSYSLDGKSIRKLAREFST